MRAAGRQAARQAPRVKTSIGAAVVAPGAYEHLGGTDLPPPLPNRCSILVRIHPSTHPRAKGRQASPLSNFFGASATGRPTTLHDPSRAFRPLAPSNPLQNTTHQPVAAAHQPPSPVSRKASAKPREIQVSRVLTAANFTGVPPASQTHRHTDSHSVHLTSFTAHATPHSPPSQDTHITPSILPFRAQPTLESSCLPSKKKVQHWSLTTDTTAHSGTDRPDTLQEAKGSGHLQRGFIDPASLPSVSTDRDFRAPSTMDSSHQVDAEQSTQPQKLQSQGSSSLYRAPTWARNIDFGTNLDVALPPAPTAAASASAFSAGGSLSRESPQPFNAPLSSGKGLTSTPLSSPRPSLTGVQPITSVSGSVSAQNSPRASGKFLSRISTRLFPY